MCFIFGIYIIALAAVTLTGCRVLDDLTFIVNYNNNEDFGAGLFFSIGLLVLLIPLGMLLYRGLLYLFRLSTPQARSSSRLLTSFLRCFSIILICLPPVASIFFFYDIVDIVMACVGFFSLGVLIILVYFCCIRLLKSKGGILNFVIFLLGLVLSGVICALIFYALLSVLCFLCPEIDWFSL